MAHSWAPPYKRGADFGRSGRQGGLCARSPRARALGLLCGRDEGCTPEGPGVCRIEAPKRKLGDCDVAHSWAPPYKRGADFGRNGRRGGLCARSPRARALGLLCGREERCTPEGPGVCRIEAPKRQLGDCDVAHSWAPPYKRSADFGRSGRQGGLCARSPRARALGLLCGRDHRGRGCPCYRAGLASERRQDAGAKLARSERRQDAGANVRRDGTGNPDPPRR